MSHRSTRLLACALAALAATAFAGGDASKPAAQQEEPMPTFDKKYMSNQANIRVGEKIWEAQCRHCHGAAAYPGKAPKLNPGQLAPDFIFDRVTYGFGKMPGWKDVFSLEERKAVVAYIKSRSFSP